MIIVCALLGLKLNEVFRIQFSGHQKSWPPFYKITEEGLLYSHHENGVYYGKSVALQGLLLGKHKVIKIT